MGGGDWGVAVRGVEAGLSVGVAADRTRGSCGSSQVIPAGPELHASRDIGLVFASSMKMFPESDRPLDRETTPLVTQDPSGSGVTGDQGLWTETSTTAIHTLAYNHEPSLAIHLPALLTCLLLRVLSGSLSYLPCYP